ncbi:hypothetical protein BKA69DRAFT_1090375 [Paraphysoderma sedebokerense]|nr:hypothetical protein BKA69DRAFT_1090375 [Paraphysoderma sedebokerense]
MKIASAFLLLLLILSQQMSSKTSPIKLSVVQGADEADGSVIPTQDAVEDVNHNVVKRQIIRYPKIGVLFTNTTSR